MCVEEQLIKKEVTDLTAKWGVWEGSEGGKEEMELY